MILDDIKQKIEESESIVLLTHETPDGDAVGSVLAMYLALKKIGKNNVDMIMPDCPRIYNFLPCVNEIKNKTTKTPYDLAISLDCSDIKRLNGFSTYFENAKIRIEIDHHSSNTMFGDFNFVNPVAPACAQILPMVFEAIGVEIEKEIGTCLLAGIITDTGGFKYKSVTAETFEFVADLINRGVTLSDVYRKVFQVISKSSFELKKRAINRIEFSCKDKIAFTYTTILDEKELGATLGEHEGIVELGRDVEGVEVSIYLRQTEDGYKASLRSSEYVDVSEICSIFGGGGHIRAAGCTFPLTLENAKEKILKQVEKYIR